MTAKVKRVAVQLITTQSQTGTAVIALANDGTLWDLRLLPSGEPIWLPLPQLPDADAETEN